VDLRAEAAGTPIALDASVAVGRVDPEAFDNGDPGSNQLVISSADALVSPTGFAQAPTAPSWSRIPERLKARAPS